MNIPLSSYTALKGIFIDLTVQAKPRRITEALEERLFVQHPDMSFTTAAVSQEGGRQNVEDSLRKQVLIVLERLGRKYPSMRYGQVVCLAAFLARGPSSKAAWEVTDEEMLRASLEHLAGHPNP